MSNQALYSEVLIRLDRLVCFAIPVGLSSCRRLSTLCVVFLSACFSVDAEGAESWEARYEAGLKFLAEGKYLQAQEEFKAVLGNNPKSVEAHNALGISYQKAKELELARRSFQRAIELNPSFVEAQTNLGLNSLLRNETEQAVRELEKSLELNAQQPLVLFNLGVLAQQSGEPHSAVTYLEKALALQPDDGTILYNLISAYLASGQARPALERADRLLALQSADSSLYRQAGELLSKYGHAAQAVRFYEMAKRQDGGTSAAGKVPGDFDKLLADANAQFQQDAKAVAELEALVKSSPNEAIHYFKLGLMLTKLGDFSRCFDLLRRAVTQFPHSPEIRLAYALACYFTGRNDLAEQAYLRLVRMQPHSDQSHFALGNFYADLGRLQEAAASFQRAVRTKSQELPELLHAWRRTLQMSVIFGSSSVAENGAEAQSNSCGLKFLVGEDLSPSGRPGESPASFRAHGTTRAETHWRPLSVGIVVWTFGPEREVASLPGNPAAIEHAVTQGSCGLADAVTSSVLNQGVFNHV